MRDKITRT